jgi:hypothetical protein
MLALRTYLKCLGKRKDDVSLDTRLIKVIGGAAILLFIFNFYTVAAKAAIGKVRKIIPP